LPTGRFSAISPAFIARLKRAAVAMSVRVLSTDRQKNLSTYNALTSILAAKAPFRRDFLRH
jgi:hypothetical protein